MPKTRVALLLASAAGGALLAAGAAQAQVTPTAPSPAVTTGVAPAGGTLTTVTQTQSREVFDWTTFRVGSTDEVRFNQPGTSAIAFNRIANPALIDGALSANGQLWLFSPGGLIFGANARVNVGGLLATTGAYGGSFSAGNSGEFVSIERAGAGGDTLRVDSGAQIAATDYVILHAPDIRQDGRITAGGDAVLLASEAAEVYVSGSGTPEITAFEDGPGGAAVITHSGRTVGRSVTIRTDAVPVSDARQASVINLGGYVEATGIGAAGGILVQTAGGEGLVDGSGSGTTLIGDSRIVTDVANLRSTGTTGDLTVEADDAVNVFGPILTLGDLSISTFNYAPRGSTPTGDILIANNVQATGAVTIAASGRLTVGAGVTIQSDQDGDSSLASGLAGLTLSAEHDVVAGAGSFLLSGAGVGADTDAVRVFAGGSADGGRRGGGDLTVGSVTGGSVLLRTGSGFGGFSSNITTTGAVTVLGSVRSAGDVLVSTETFGSRRASAVTLNGSVTAGGSVEVTNADGGDVRLLGDVLADGAVALRADRDVSLASGLTVQADRDMRAAAGEIVIDAGRDVRAAGTTLWVGGSDVDADGDPIVVLTGNVSVVGGSGERGQRAGNVELGSVLGLDVGVFAASNDLYDPDLDTFFTYGGAVTVGGPITAGGDVNILSLARGSQSSAAVSVGDVFAGGTVDVSNDAGGDVLAQGDITADGSVLLRGDRDVLISANRRIQGDADGDGLAGNGPAGVYVTALRNVTAGAGSLLLAGTGPANLTGDVEVYAGGYTFSLFSIGEGGALEVANAAGRNVTLVAFSGEAGPGNVTVGGTISAADQALIETRRIAEISFPCDGPCEGRPDPTAAPTPPSLTPPSFGVITIGAGAVVQGDADGDGIGGVDVRALTDVVADPTSLLLSGASAATPSGSVRAAAGFEYPQGDFFGGNLTLGRVIGANVQLSANAGPIGGGNVILAGDVISRDELTVQALSWTGDVDGESVVNVGDIYILAGVTLRGDADGDGGGYARVWGDRSIFADASSLIATGSSGLPGSANIDIAAGGGTTGGDLMLGRVSGARVDINAYAGDQAAGDITLAGDVAGSRSVLIAASRDVVLEAGVTVRADADGDISGEGGEALEIRATRDVVGASAALATGLVGGPGTADIYVTAGDDPFERGSPGGDIRIGALTGQNVSLSARAGVSDGTARGGSIDVYGPVLTTGTLDATVEGYTDLVFDPETESETEVYRTTGGHIVFASTAAASAGGAVTLDNRNGGDIGVNADLRSDAGVILQADRDVAVASSVTIQADRDLLGEAGEILVEAGRDVIASGSTLLGGAYRTEIVNGVPTQVLNLTAPVTVRAGASERGQQAGNVDMGSAVGASVTVAARSDALFDPETEAFLGLYGGAITTSSLVGGAFVDVSNSGGSQANAGRIRLSGPVTSGGGIRVDNQDGGDIRVDFYMAAGDGLSLRADRDVVLSPGAELHSDLFGRGSDSTTDRTLEVLAGRDVSATGSTLVGGADASNPTADVVVIAGYRQLRGGAPGGPQAAPGFGGPGGSATIGAVSGQNVSLIASAGFEGGGSVSLTGDVRADDLLSISGLSYSEPGEEVAGDVTVASGVTLQGDADGDGVGGVNIESARSFRAAADSLILGGAGVTSLTAPVTIVAGASTDEGFGGGDLISGRIMASDITLRALYFEAGGGIAVTGALSASDSILIENVYNAGSPSPCTFCASPGLGGALAAPPPPPAVSILADMTAAGDVNVTSVDEIYVDAGVTVRANADGDASGGLTFHAARSISALAGSALGAGAAGQPGAGAVQIIAGYPVPRVNLVGGDLVAASVFGGDVLLRANAGAGAAGNVTASGPVNAGNLDLLAQGFARLGDVTSRGYVVGTAGTDFTVTGRVTAAGAVSLSALRGSIQLDPGASVRSDDDGAGAEGISLDASGDLVMSVGSLIATGSAGGPATGDVSLTAGQAFGFGGPDAGDLTLADLRVNNLSLTAARAGATGGNLRVIGNAAAAGDVVGAFRTVTLSSGAVLRGDADGAGGGDVRIDADGAFTGAAGSLVASGRDGSPGTGLVRLRSGVAGAGGDLALGSVSGGTLQLTAGPGSATGALTVTGALTSAGAATLTAAQGATVNTVTTGGAFDLTAGGQVQLNGPSDVGAMSVVSTGAGASVNAAVVSRGAAVFSARGASGVLAFNAGVAAAGGLSGESRRGAITLAGGTVLRGDSDGDGLGGVTLGASGDLTLGALSRVVTGTAGGAATGDVSLSAGSAFGLGGPDAGSLTFAEVSGRDVSLTARRAGGSGGVVNAGSASATGLLTLSGYDVNLGTASVLRGDSDGLGAGGVGVAASRNVNGAAGSLVASGLAGGPGRGAMSVTAGAGGIGGDLTLGTVRGGDVTIGAIAGAGGAGDATVAGAVDATGNLIFSAGRDARLDGPTTVAGNADATGLRNLTVGSITTGGRLVASAAAGDLGLTAAASSGTDMMLSATQGGLTADGLLTAGGTLRATASGNVALGSVAGGSDVDVIAGGVARFGASSAVGRFAVQAGGAIGASGPITAGGLLRLRSTGGALNASGALTAGGDLNLSGSGVTLNGAVSAGGGVAIDGVAGDVLLNGDVRGDADGNGAGAVVIRASRNLTFAPGAALYAGVAGGPVTTSATLAAGWSFGSPGAGDLTLGSATAGGLFLSAGRAGARAARAGWCGSRAWRAFQATSASTPTTFGWRRAELCGPMRTAQAAAILRSRPDAT